MNDLAGCGSVSRFHWSRLLLLHDICARALNLDSDCTRLECNFLDVAGHCNVRMLSAARVLRPEQKWALAENALQYAEDALNTMVAIMHDPEAPASARIMAADKILNRALGKAPAHIDITALRHTEIVYRSAEEIRAALLARGLPPALLDLRPADVKDKDDDDDSGED